MSSFSDILQSIGGDKAPEPPPKTSKTPVKQSSPIRLSSTPARIDPTTSSSSLKRKAQDDAHLRLEKTAKTDVKYATSGGARMGQQSAIQTGSTPENVSLLSGIPSASSAAVPRAPAKGSYADIMARAKAAQEQRGQNQVGIIKHQAAIREKTSRMMERRKEEEDKKKGLKSKLGPRFRPGDRIEKRRSASPTKGKEVVDARSTKPRVTQQSVSSYRGTMGLSSRKVQDQRDSKPPRIRRRIERKRHSRYDEYLGTDEEDDSEILDAEMDEEEDNNSQESSDMEAGAFDLEQEERKALKTAKEEDARELALEQSLKQEKEERRRRLQAMARKEKR